MDKAQIDSLKKQVLDQLKETLSPDKFSSVKEQIENLNDEDFLEFLRKNNAFQDNSSGEKCIFCSIIFNEIPSYKIDENEKAIAVLEINPISRGHVLILPKNHGDVKTDKELASMIKTVSEKLKKKLSAKEVKTAYSKTFGHTVINLIPIYEGEELNSERSHAGESELNELKNLLSSKERTKKKVSKPKVKKVKEKNLWLPRRIP